MHRTALTAAAACALLAALTGCAAAAPAGPATSTPRAVSATDATSAPPVVSSSQPSPTESAVADPEPAEPASDPAPTGDPAPTVSALAQHVYDECSKGAADARITLRLTDHPSGSSSNGGYLLIYPFTFTDGHDDPYAIYDCLLTDDTVDSTFVSGGLSDAH